MCYIVQKECACNVIQDFTKGTCDSLTSRLLAKIRSLRRCPINFGWSAGVRKCGHELGDNRKASGQYLG